MEDLQHYPITTKAGLLASGRDGYLRAGVEERTLSRRSTTGTQGTPITVFASRSETLFRKVTLFDSFRRLTKLPLPLAIADVGVEQGKAGTDVVQRLRLVHVDRIFRAYPIAEQVLRMSRLSPELIEGRPSSLWTLALEARQQGVLLPQPRLVASFGEVLYPHVRQLLSEVFGCHVADFYNCEEVGNVAWECPHRPGLMHVNPATTILEVVDDSGAPAPQGQAGRVLLTNLYNRTMPFIRYDIRDRAAILDVDGCSCGFAGQSICLVEGRDEDFFCLPDGRQVSPRKVYETVAGILPFKDLGNDLFHSIHEFQIIQELHDLVTVNVIAGPNYTSDVWRGVKESIQALHPDMRVQVHVVDKLEFAPGGKFKAVMSRVESRRIPD
jgi:phenylacetate-CoA ligase